MRLPRLPPKRNLARFSSSVRNGDGILAAFHKSDPGGADPAFPAALATCSGNFPRPALRSEAVLSGSIGIAAIDAGSNAIRAVVARAFSPRKIKEVAAERLAIRLGHPVFARGRLDRQATARTLAAFRHFR